MSMAFCMSDVETQSVKMNIFKISSITISLFIDLLLVCMCDAGVKSTHH